MKQKMHNGFGEITSILSLSLIFASCGGARTGDADSSSEEIFQHADRDIAMTVCSLADALRVGEPFDSTIYNYVGVLTDGEGYNLYWDKAGYPGQWEVLVVNPDSVVIRNLKSGDLRVNALREYISSNMEFSDEDMLENSDLDNDNQIEKTIYAIDNGRLSFELLEDNTPLGEEGPFLNISLYRPAN